MGLKDRELNTKPRGKVTKRRKPIILIATEGKNKTETIYFNNLNSFGKYSIVFCKGNYTDPINTVKVLDKEIKKIKEQRIEDKAYCVFDTDVDISKNDQITKAKALASKTKIELIISNPCFEVWYLCHYMYSTKAYNCNEEAISKLKKYISNYNKKTNIFSILKSNINNAISNAEKLQKYHQGLGREIYSLESNPSTEIYKIIKEIL